MYEALFQDQVQNINSRYSNLNPTVKIRLLNLLQEQLYYGAGHSLKKQYTDITLENNSNKLNVEGGPTTDKRNTH